MYNQMVRVDTENHILLDWHFRVVQHIEDSQNRFLEHEFIQYVGL